MRDGYELALAAALGGRLDAALVRDLSGANTLLDGAGPDGASALLAGDAADAPASEAHAGANEDMRPGTPAQDVPARDGHGSSPDQTAAPAPGAVRLIELVSGSDAAPGARAATAR